MTAILLHVPARWARVASVALLLTALSPTGNLPAQSPAPINPVSLIRPGTHTGVASIGTSDSLPDAYRAVAARIVTAALADTTAYQRLVTLADRFGPRLSGSAGLEAAIDFVLAGMKRDGLQHVHGEPVQVPHWVRGEESAMLTVPRHAPLSVLGLGGTVATPPEGITAPVLVVSSFADLNQHASQVRGRIVVFDVPFTTYGATVRYRVQGPSIAARLGAVATLMRSLTSQSLATVHTGSVVYDTTVQRIPAAAVTVEDAEMLHRMQDAGDQIVLTLSLDDHTLPNASSRNVVAEIVGRELPGEVVLVGGHIDSWDVGEGAMDDGAGSIVAWEAVRLLHDLGLKPRRTIRVFLATNEENGFAGLSAYVKAHSSELRNHVLGIQTDDAQGVFRPVGLAVRGSSAATQTLGRIAHLLDTLGADSIWKNPDAPDVGVVSDSIAPIVSVQVDGPRYFWYHHSAADTIDKISARDLESCIATVAIVAYVAADMPGRP